MSDLARQLVEEISRDPAALARLRELVAETRPEPVSAKIYSVSTLAAELGRSERSVRAAIARGELQAVKRGRGWVISSEAVETWARAPVTGSTSTPVNPRARGSHTGARSDATGARVLDLYESALAPG